MKQLVEEYGVLVVTILGCMFALWVYTYSSEAYKEYSKEFIGNITGNYISYDTDITLEEIERSE